MVGYGALGKATVEALRAFSPASVSAFRHGGWCADELALLEAAGEGRSTAHATRPAPGETCPNGRDEEKSNVGDASDCGEPGSCRSRMPRARQQWRGVVWSRAHMLTSRRLRRASASLSLRLSRARPRVAPAIESDVIASGMVTMARA